MQGQYEDSETGLYYNRYRYFDANISAYISQDPIRLNAGTNLYFYGLNSIMWIDPMGLACKKVKNRAAKKATKKKKPTQVHHYATNKNKKYKPRFEEIANKYDLDLDGDWNKEALPHQGRHPNEYHEYVLENMKNFDEVANGNKDLFLKQYDALKDKIKANPDMLYKKYWLKKG